MKDLIYRDKIYQKQKEVFELGHQQKLANLSSEIGKLTTKILKLQQHLETLEQQKAKESSREFPSKEEFFRSKQSQESKSSES